MLYSSAEIKLIGDEYAGFYSCGLTMLGSSTMRKFSSVTHSGDTVSYNEPTGGQLVIREYEGKKLVVYHRFRDSVSITAFAEANGIELDLGDPIDSYGCADQDFSAESYILEAT
jgi:alpha-galactosidase